MDELYPGILALETELFRIEREREALITGINILRAKAGWPLIMQRPLGTGGVVAGTSSPTEAEG